MVEIVKATRDVWREEVEDGYTIHFRNRSSRRFKALIWPVAILAGLFPFGTLVTIMAWVTKDEPGAEGIFATLFTISICLTTLLGALVYWMYQEHLGSLKITKAGVEVDQKLFALRDIKRIGFASHGRVKPFAGFIEFEFGDRKIPVITGLHADATERVYDLLVQTINEVLAENL